MTLLCVASDGSIFAKDATYIIADTSCLTSSDQIELLRSFMVFDPYHVTLPGMKVTIVSKTPDIRTGTCIVTIIVSDVRVTFLEQSRYNAFMYLPVVHVSQQQHKALITAQKASTLQVLNILR